MYDQSIRSFYECRFVGFFEAKLYHRHRRAVLTVAKFLGASPLWVVQGYLDFLDPTTDLGN